MGFDMILSLIIGVLVFELINRFYLKGDKKKVGYALIGGVIVAIFWYILT